MATFSSQSFSFALDCERKLEATQFRRKPSFLSRCQLLLVTVTDTQSCENRDSASQMISANCWSNSWDRFLDLFILPQCKSHELLRFVHLVVGLLFHRQPCPRKASLLFNFKSHFIYVPFSCRISTTISFFQGSTKTWVTLSKLQKPNSPFSSAFSENEIPHTLF